MKSLQVLHLEDSPIDAELIAATLAEEELDCEITVVEGTKGFTDIQREINSECAPVLADPAQMHQMIM